MPTKAMSLRPFYFLILLALAWSACNSNENSENASSDSRYGNVLVMNQFTHFDVFFPPMAYEGAAAQLGSQFYETLVAYSAETGKLIPLLAERWTNNKEFTEFKFKIRKGVFFHDNRCFPDGKGREMKPEDVLYVLKSLCENSRYNKNSGLLSGQVKGGKEFFNGRKRASDDVLEGITLNSEDELVIKLINPNVEFIHVLAHYVTSVYPAEAKVTYGINMDDSPVGTGPFVNKLFRKNEVCLMVRNEKYWGRDEKGQRLPYLDGIKMGFSSSGSNVRQAMDKGLIHLVMDPDVVEDGGQVLEICDQDFSPYSKRQVQDLETTFLGFLNDEGIFFNKNLRKAFSYAIDREAIMNEVMINRGTPGLHGLVPPAFSGYPFDQVRSARANVDSAKYYLAAAGYPDGKGFPATNLQIQNRFKDAVVAQVIQKQVLVKLGISLSITAVPKDQHFKRIEDRQTQLWLDYWIGDFMDPQNFLSLMLSRNTPENKSSFLNIYRFKNDDFDSLINDALEENQINKRMDLYSQADRLLMSEAALLPLYYERMQVIQHASLKGVYDPVLGRFDFRKAYIETPASK